MSHLNGIPLDKLLQSQGFGTRRACRALVERGSVKIGDETVTDGRQEIMAHDGLEFTVDGIVWRYRPKVYLALNKPAGIECSRRPTHHRGVLALLPDHFTLRGVQPVGRLDHDTTGLLLLSDDGAFIHALSHPKRQIEKTYQVTTSTPVTPEVVIALQRGVLLKDEPAPLKASVRQTGTHILELTLAQGKYHQVKRMLAAAGSHCAALHRIAIGGLTLQSLALPEGGWCHLDGVGRFFRTG